MDSIQPADSDKPRRGRPPTPLADRLWAKVVKRGSGCWEYAGTRNESGYGRIDRGRGGGLVFTHRAAWEATNGPIPTGLVVRHRCDNPPCCNPAHLELGTRADNVQDRVDRQRGYINVPEDTVRAIREAVANGAGVRATARTYGVSPSYVSDIAKGRYRRLDARPGDAA